MRFSRTYVPAFLSLLLIFPAFAQQTTPSTSSNPQALTLLQKSLAALTGGQPITDVTLSGTARRIAGSDDESGSATLKALASGAGRMDLSLSSGPRSEVENLSAAPPAGSWSGPDSVSHPIAFHNLLNEPAWFFPAFALARSLSTSGSTTPAASYIVSYIGHETRDGQAVEHVSVAQTAPFPDPPGAPTFAHLTQVDFFLDSATLLPAAITFNIHPDNNALLDLPVEIRFSDYRVVSPSGVVAGLQTGAVSSPQIPFHIQKFLNNSLLLDFQAQTVTPNSGLTASTFGAL